MEAIIEALQLLKRQVEIQHALRRDSTTRVIEEREFYLIRQRLNRYPAALQAIAFGASELHRPVDALSIRDGADKLSPRREPTPLTLARIAP
jgi:hypothetical protein